MERRELVVKKRPVLVCEEIANLLGIGRVLDINYDYTHICRSVSDRSRISGIAFSILVSRNFNEHKSQSEFDWDYEYDCLNWTPSDTYRLEKGTNLRIGKFAAAVFPEKSQQEIALIGDRWGHLLRQSNEADLSELQITDKPSEIYGNYDGNFCSCMNNAPQSRFEIYDDLEHTRLLYLLRGRYIQGRALLHDKVNSPLGEIKVMDRIYYADADILAMFVQYAIKNGYMRKTYQSLGCCTYVYPWSEETVTLQEMWIECGDLRDSYEQVPYIDTFAHYYIDKHGDHFLSSSDFHGGRNPETSMRNTEGTDTECIISGDALQCASCGDGMSPNDGIYVGGLGQICDSCAEDYYWCECCDEYIYADHAVFVQDEVYCQYHANQRFTRCYECGEYVPHSEAREVYDHGYVCEECLERGAFFKCAECGGWFKQNYSNATYDGSVCDSCFDSCYAQCSSCEEYFHEDDMEDGKCKSCFETEEEPA